MLISIGMRNICSPCCSLTVPSLQQRSLIAPPCLITGRSTEELSLLVNPAGLTNYANSLEMCSGFYSLRERLTKVQPLQRKLQTIVEKIASFASERRDKSASSLPAASATRCAESNASSPDACGEGDDPFFDVPSAERAPDSVVEQITALITKLAEHPLVPEPYHRAFSEFVHSLPPLDGRDNLSNAVRLCVRVPS